jgi:nucleoside 2-deoxyribosyltransferase
MKVYLAGPINGCTDEECDGWRGYCKARLPQVEWLDPTDHDFRGKESENAEEIVRLDKEMILSSDYVLANCWKPGWGTAMEIMYAFFHGKKVVAVSERPSPWVTTHCRRVYPSLDMALGFIEGAKYIKDSPKRVANWSQAQRDAFNERFPKSE